MEKSEKTVLKFREDGTFRVVMMSDLQESAQYDPRSLRSVEAVLDETDPDLVVLVGVGIFLAIFIVSYFLVQFIKKKKKK